MNKLRFIALVIFVISIPFVQKALDLYNRFYNEVRDGDGIGLYFLGIEINDRLPYGQIPCYLWIFWTAFFGEVSFAFFSFNHSLIERFRQISLLYSDIIFKRDF